MLVEQLNETAKSLRHLKDFLQEVGTGDDTFKVEVAIEMLENRIEDLNGVVGMLQSKSDLQPETHLHLV